MFLQIIDPDAFGGGAAFRSEMDWVTDACRRSAPRVAGLPGEQALALADQGQRDGIGVAPALAAGLVARARSLGADPPAGWR